ncbi:Fe-S cluster assembly protein SufD [Loktanella fryxellensis]|uniref:Fe-S cluster assembly protein SufD n=1 Tax=Loktanella fryxellensis TaxID=245187 RepID=A0A1H8F8A9_9RHOB|nr:SufD family Fe-S cluster assembly protein [Loktanella fryxellensis]SEN27736.1 Fe-S cluster assembly protein SufD [Loktanella fryxellensis]
MALDQRRTVATDARLAASLPAGPAWLTTARQAAADRVAAMGLPVRRDEYWRYTDPTTLVARDAVPADLLAVGDDPEFSGIDAVCLVFVDGVFDATQSDDPKLAGATVTRLADAQDAAWADGLLGQLEARGQTPVARPLAALTTAMAADGVLIHVTGQAGRAIHLRYDRRDAAADVALHHVVKLEAGTTLTLLESGAGAARFASNMEVDVADGATFHHVRAQGRDHGRRMNTHTFTRIGADATFKSFTLSVNGALTRNDCIMEIMGDHATAHVAGASVGDGDAFHHDDTIFITHDAVGCESRQVFKKVLRNGAVGVFQGKILVKHGAQKTDGYQISQSLLLDGDSQFLAKPELEIYADDVACSHGSTSGAIDEDALFYLRSRGVPHRTATTLLTLSFLAEALQEIADEALADDLRDRLAGWLDRHAH